VRLGEQARARIVDGTFDAWRRAWLARLHQGATQPGNGAE
jgi:hypothetical protein